MEIVLEHRFIDECMAWEKVNSHERLVLEELGKLKAFCEINTYVNQSQDGGFYVLSNHRDRPILSAMVYRDSANYSIVQIVNNNENLKQLKDYVEDQSKSSGVCDERD